MKYPESKGSTNSSVDPNPRLMTTKEQNQLRGIETGKTGELAEHKAFMAMHNLSLQEHPQCFLSLHTLDLDTKSKRCSKRMQLLQELPKLSDQLNTRLELDVVVLVADLGVISVEVKSSASKENIAKADKQLNESERFFTSIMSAIEDNTKTAIPIPFVRVICVPDETSPSPSSKTVSGCHILHQDIISCSSRLKIYWDTFLGELFEKKVSSTFSVHDFNRFTKLVVGLWSSKSAPSGLVFERLQASKVSRIQTSDSRVDTGVLSSDPDNGKRQTEACRKLPLTNISRIFLTTRLLRFLDSAKRWNSCISLLSKKNCSITISIV